MEIRSPLPSDEAQWRTLWEGYNTFYGTDVDDEVTSWLWSRLMTPGDSVFGRFVIHDDDVAGFAVCVLHPYTWGTRPACLLEDLYVDPARRGAGLARRLLEHLIDEGPAQGWGRLYWHTREDNAVARHLYDAFTGADGFVRYTIPFTGTIATAGGSQLAA